MSKDLNQKIVDIMRGAQAISKTGRNDNQKYDYVQAADVIREVRGLIAEQNLRLKSEITCIDRQPCGKMTLATITIKYYLIDTETGEADVTTMIAEGADSGDKAINKAMTSGLKYYFRDMFLLDFADDSEATQSQPVGNNRNKTSTKTTSKKSDASSTQKKKPMTEAERKAKGVQMLYTEARNKNLDGVETAAILKAETKSYKDSANDLTLPDLQRMYTFFKETPQEILKETATSLLEQEQQQAS